MDTAQRLIDVNASLGHWPFRMLRHNTPEGLAVLMDAHGIGTAWVASLDCVLNREVKTANLAFAESIARHRGRLLPFATVDPSFPTWDADIDLYLGDLAMNGFRTYPNYHGYTLSDPCFAELVACADEYGVPLQIAVRIADERMHHPLMKVPPVDLGGLEDQLDAAKSAKIVLLNVRQPEFTTAARLAEAHSGVFIEISHVESIGGVSRLFERFPEEQVLFGTHAPLFYPLSAIHKLKEADLTAEQLDSISGSNAEGVLGSL